MTTLFVLVIVAALVFTFTNGIHDAANAIATVVSTGVLKPRTAILMAAVLNLIGSTMGSAVARTVSTDLVDPRAVGLLVVLSAFIAAITWNLVTWRMAIPSSSSHAVVGGLIGGAWAAGGFDAVLWSGVLRKVVVPLFLSPAAGFFAALTGMIVVYWIVRRSRPSVVNNRFRRLQLASCAYMAWSHGLADAQKTTGVVTIALFSVPGQSTTVPLWLVLACAVAMGVGTLFGGWSIIETMGSRILKLRPIHGFVAETSAATVNGLSALLGVPTSTTQAITGAIMGAGATTRLSAVSWGLTRRIGVVWVLTLPACGLLSAGIWWVLDAAL
jgi:PiT family inorganic phosphate transporter